MVILITVCLFIFLIDELGSLGVDFGNFLINSILYTVATCIGTALGNSMFIRCFIV